MQEKLFAAGCLLIYAIGGITFFMNLPQETANRATLEGWLRITWDRIKGIVSRWPGIDEILQKQKRQMQGKKMEMEIYNSGLLLKNLALTGNEGAFSADYLYERLLEHSEKMRPIYAQMLAMYRAGKDAEAFRFVAESCPTKAGKNFSLILEKVNRLPMDELVEQIEVFQELIRQQKMTEDMRSVQRNSLVTMIMAMITVFLMVIDFAVVVVFMHTMNILTAAL